MIDVHPTTTPTESPRRRVGRPPGDQPPAPALPAEPVMLLDRVPAQNCPRCGRGQQPRVLRRRGTTAADCACALCGGEFVYTFPTVRVKP